MSATKTETWPAAAKYEAALDALGEAVEAVQLIEMKLARTFDADAETWAGPRPSAVDIGWLARFAVSLQTHRDLLDEEIRLICEIRDSAALQVSS